ncbi:hypothetical protein [Mucilaginibacter sp.]|uniref:hypothetical protein n=1 Tax=Mucilaginibacter sp. TaxID=1882438 RepID=UPI0026295A43|nr:hypothetical protein [Mucilaginibacter sp.]MDB4924115.1 hypothetical protein [Mucilaginibacter sp.]
MKKALCYLTVCFYLIVQTSFAQSIKIVRADKSAQTLYAVSVLKKALLQQKTDYQIALVIDSTQLSKEAYSINPAGKKITITGGDGKGILYGCLSVAENVRNGTTLQNIKASAESPNLPFRAIKFNLPWDPYRTGHAVDLHMETCKDVNYWRAFLDMMAQNRFNTLTLWNLHPFPYMIKPKNFPEASPFTDAELKAWQNLYHAIFRMAKERGIDTYIVNWNIFVTTQFAKAHQVATSNIKNRIHYGDADTSEIVKKYNRECVTQMLDEYPDLTGMGFTEGEAMNGMTPEARNQWVKDVIITGMKLAKRKTKLIFRVPLSAGVSDGGSTSVNVEKLTRKTIEAETDFDGPIWTEFKFNWSHGHSTTKLLKVHGGKLSDTYFKPEPINYKTVWTTRNEDFFCLRWGNADFIRAHIAANTPSYAGGYIIGSEGYIPAKDYFTKIKGPVNWKYAFERQWLFYKLWGRLLYNPATPDVVFREEFIHRYGKQATPLLEAYSLASKTPLRLACSFDFTWDFSLYSEGFMAMNKKKMSYISVDQQINQATFDPDYVSIKDYVKNILAKGDFKGDQITPPILADQLEADCKKALALVKDIKTANNNTLMYEVADVKTWANLGLYFAEKLRGGVALQTYRTIGREENKQHAITHLQNALIYWDEVVKITRPIYNDMPYTGYTYPADGNNSVINNTSRFHWALLRPDVAKDVETAKNATYISKAK